jgi:mono/diheme cytochrome c family protein
MRLAGKSAVAIAPAGAQDAPPGDAAKGKRIYLATGCFACHGRNGQGGAFNGPAPVLTKSEYPFDSFKLLLREPPGDMPAYAEKVMPDQEVADIYAYLQTLPGRRAAREIGILND